MSTSAGEDAQQESIVTSNGKSKGGSPTVLPHKPLLAKESGAYDHLEASESFRYVDDTCGKNNRIKAADVFAADIDSSVLSQGNLHQNHTAVTR